MFKLTMCLALSLMSLSAFAENPDASRYAIQCKEVGKEKVTAQAQAYGLSLVDEVHATYVDDRFYNPSKYIMYTANGRDAAGKVYVVNSLVQYYGGQCL